MNVIDVLTHAVEEAAKTIGSIKHSDLSVDMKGSRDLVTSADKASQEVILEILHREFPGTHILAEEQEVHSIPTSTYFAVDPIDGTFNFLHGAPDWGITIGFIEDGRPVSGVFSLPRKGITVSAERGNGCYKNGSRVVISKPPPLARSLIGSDVGWFVGEDRLKGKLLPIVKKALGIRSILGAIASTGELLDGIIKAYISLHGAKVWDFAAGVVAVEEAGGYCGATDGSALRWDAVHMNALFAASKELADEILAVK